MESTRLCDDDSYLVCSVCSHPPLFSHADRNVIATLFAPRRCARLAQPQSRIRSINQQDAAFLYLEQSRWKACLDFGLPNSSLSFSRSCAFEPASIVHPIRCVKFLQGCTILRIHLYRCCRVCEAVQFALCFRKHRHIMVKTEKCSDCRFAKVKVAALPARIFLPQASSLTSY